MLKVLSGSNCGPIECEFGDYVPFKISHQSKTNSPKLYWRTGNFKSTLLEVEINRETGLIGCIILLLPGQASRDFPALILPESEQFRGFPIVDVSNWPDDRVKDEPNEIRVFIDESRLLVSLSPLSIVKKTYSVDHVVFGVDADDSLVWILIDNLPEDKLNVIETM